MLCCCVGVFCTSDAFHSKIRNDSSDQVCVSVDRDFLDCQDDIKLVLCAVFIVAEFWVPLYELDTGQIGQPQQVGREASRGLPFLFKAQPLVGPNSDWRRKTSAFQWLSKPVSAAKKGF